MSLCDSPFDLSFFDGATAVAVMVSYYDASEIGDHLTIGGVLFRKKHVRPFEKEWRAMLRKFEIDHFHMTDCNARRGEFEGRSPEDCDACARKAISIILKYVQKGVIFSVSKTDFADVIGANGFMPNPFTLGVWYAMFDTRYWADNNDPTARISYVFESGDTHQRDAEHLLSGIAEEAGRAAGFRYNGHAFLPKRLSFPTQAADILAWHGAKQADRNDRGYPSLRGDFDAIVSQLHVSDGKHERSWLEKLVEISRRNVEKTGIAGIPVPPEHADEVVRLSYLANKSNFRQSSARIGKLLRLTD